MQPKNKSVLSILPASQEALNNILDISLELWWGHLLVGFSDGSAGKESHCNTGDPSLIPGSGRSAGEGMGYPLQYSWASLVAQLVKNLPVMRETWVRSLGWGNPLRRERLPTPVFWPRGHKELDTTE